MAGVTSEGKLLNLIKDAQKKHRLRKDLKVFTKINILLIALILIILIVFLVDFLNSSQEKPKFIVELPEEEELILPIAEDIEEEIAIEEKPLVSKEELVKDLTVLGIITGDDDQIIIEDKTAGKTFFLYKGDSFGDFNVNEIKDNSVILDYKGEKIELNM
ncbi:MAG: hypothetical protein KKD11_01845 [Candidatus Omnitrophica bacterium]|nr:hypothetical protein [Candidatus Omnitrophota bacterium]